MTIETRQINVTLLFSEEMAPIATLRISELSTIMVEAFENLPTVTQFPGLIAIVHPETQTSIVVENKRIIVSNGEAKTFEARNIASFLKLVSKVYMLFTTKHLVAYGFNYIFNAPIEEGHISGIKLFNLVNTKELGLVPADIIGTGVGVTFKRLGTRYQIQTTPAYGVEIDQIHAIDSTCNLHVPSPTLPELTDLTRNFTDCFNEMRDHLTTMLSKS